MISLEIINEMLCVRGLVHKNTPATILHGFKCLHLNPDEFFAFIIVLRSEAQSFLNLLMSDHGNLAITYNEEIINVHNNQNRLNDPILRFEEAHVDRMFIRLCDLFIIEAEKLLFAFLAPTVTCTLQTVKSSPNSTHGMLAPPPLFRHHLPF